MRKNIGEFSESIKKLYGSLRKRFGLQYDETLEYADRAFSKTNYPIIFISSDDSLSLDFIKELNESNNGQAIGFYRDGEYVYNVEELREMVPKLLDIPNKFVYISIEKKSRFRLAIANSILVKIGNAGGQLWIDIELNEKVDGEVIKRLTMEEVKEFASLFSRLYLNRYECRPDIFDKGYKLSTSDLRELCRTKVSKGVLICIRNEKIVGFIVYEFATEKENRGYLSRSDLVVRDIFVVDEYRRLGIASRLFNEVKKIASHLKCENILFKVWEFDEATCNFLASLHHKTLYGIYEVEV